MKKKRNNTIKKKVSRPSGEYEGEVNPTNLGAQGIGIYRYNNGDRYDGTWDNGYRTGRGIYYFANGSIYSGMWSNNLKHGEGLFRFANGDEYEGTYKNDYRWNGELRDSDGNIKIRYVNGVKGKPVKK